MSDPETLPGGVHPEVELLPWYANETLAEADRQRVARHLESCSVCTRELEDIAEIRHALTALYRQEGEPSAQLARSVMTRVAAERGRQSRSPEETSWAAGLDRWVRILLMPQWVPTLAAVLLVAQTGLLIWLALPAPERAEVSTRSLGMQTARIALVFQPLATEEQIRLLLRRLGAQFVDGPTGDGVFTITVNTDDASVAAALALLREQPSVIRSARLVHP